MSSDQAEGRRSAPRWLPWLALGVGLVMLLGSWGLVTMDQPGVPKMFVVEHRSQDAALGPVEPEPDAPPPALIGVRVDKTFGPRLSLEQARAVIDPLAQEIVRCYVLTDARVVLTLDFRVSDQKVAGVEVRPRPRDHARFRSCVEATLEGSTFPSVTGERPSFVKMSVGRLEN